MPDRPTRRSSRNTKGARTRVGRSVRAFLATETSGGVVLLAAAVVALAWANGPFAASYEDVWTTDIHIRLGALDIRHDARHWINEGLMTVFFLVVGLEIKRELLVGELSDRRKAIAPLLAATGGMVVPALIYAALNAGGRGGPGWAIPMATDIAFAVGLLAILGDRVAPGLKVFLLSLAIVDDIGAIAVIAVFYARSLDVGWVIAAIVLGSVVAGMRRAGLSSTVAYVGVGIAMWFSTLESGVHATIAGVAFAFLLPTASSKQRGDHRETSIADTIDRALHPWSSYLVVPLFALANAGIRIDLSDFGHSATSPVALGAFLGLVVGKLVGVTAGSLVARAIGFALPADVGVRDIVGVAAIAGIGFTVSLFITDLAFVDPELIGDAKLGIVAGSVTSAAVGVAVLAGIRRRRRSATGVDR